jgi:hypothetical protein
VYTACSGIFRRDTRAAGLDQKPAAERSMPGSRSGTASLAMIEGFLGLSVSGSYDIALTAVMPRSSRSIGTYVPALGRPSEFLMPWEPVLDGMREARLPKT